jgi:hypothetical protein
MTLSEMSRLGGRSRSPAKLVAVQKNLIKARTVLAARRSGSNVSASASASNVSTPNASASTPSVETRKREKPEGLPEAPSVVGEAPVAGQHYVRRNGRYIKARPGPRECIWIFNGTDFCACGLSE